MLGTRTRFAYVSALTAMIAVAATPLFGAPQEEPAAADSTSAVSYQRDVRPIFQSRCWSCHQPANSHGDYVMTSSAELFAGGASDKPAIVPHEPDASNLIQLITPDSEGLAEMPRDNTPLSESERETIRRWIAEGAVDDSVDQTVVYNADHPPEYSTLPVITALDFSPNGEMLAVNGFHEVVLLSTSDWSRVGRLIGLSQRIESIAFSPDGTKLLVTGGLPGQFGEIQIWDVAQQSLLHSVPITHDVVFGGSWSADGKSVSFGCADNTVRAIDAETAKPTLYLGAHDDWVLDTVFSTDASHLISVGRDMTCKLTEVATNRFIDNVTSITPGALKGGLAAVARLPQRDEIIVGGSDGVPRLYRMFRLTKRVIGDDANLVRQFPGLLGRIQSVDISADGKRFLAASSLDRRGQLRVFSLEVDSALPDNLKAIHEKVVTSRSAEENAALEAYRTADVNVISTLDSEQSGLYAARFHPAGEYIAAGGDHGELLLVDVATGTIKNQLIAVPLSGEGPVAESAQLPHTTSDAEGEAAAAPPTQLAVVSLVVDPPSVELSDPYAECQLIVTGQLESGDLVDVTRAASYHSENGCVAATSSGRISPTRGGDDHLTIRVGPREVKIPVKVAGFDEPYDVDFLRDINPVLSRVGCNAGTCHGAQQGKNGFKLSLRGYDPIFDVRAFTDDLRCRRINKASPADSLMLAKASGAVAHGGGIVLPRDSLDFELLRRWITAGAPLDLSTPRVNGIEVRPASRVLSQVGDQQQLRVVATYADGRQRDVTRLAFIESGKTDVVEMDSTGVATARRRGDAPVLVRFEGQYATAVLTVMGDRSGFEWADVPANNRIDELVADKWKAMKILPAPLCSDEEFLRRVHLDLTGLPPGPDEIRQFLDDQRPTETKRAEVVDRLIGSPPFIDYWTNKWCDLLLVNRKYLGPESAAAFRRWVREQVEANRPYDMFVREILTASGSNREHPPVSYYKIHRTPAQLVESTTHLFLGIRFNCNKCHDHPFERWTQDQYYETAAYFSQVSFAEDPQSNGVRVGGTDVEPSRPVYEILSDNPEGQVRHDRTGEITDPQFPFVVGAGVADDASPREALAHWIANRENPYFAKSYANRLWSYLLGTGLIEPVDDIRAGNPPSNPELLEYLTEELIASGFDSRHLIRLICNSRVYQLSVQTNPFNEDDTLHYSHAMARRLPAEVLFDAIHSVLGVQPQIPGVEPGLRAVQLPDSGVNVPGGFLQALGRPARESVCECERRSDLPLGPVMALATGPVVSQALVSDSNRLREMVDAEPDDRRLIEQLFLRILCRLPSDDEIDQIRLVWESIEQDYRELDSQLQTAQQAYDASVPELEAQRQKRIGELESALAEAEVRLKPDEERREAERVAKVTELEKNVAEARNSLNERIAGWEANTPLPQTLWSSLQPVSFESKAGARWVTAGDRRLLVTETKGPDEYDVQLRPAARRMTALRLEVLTDDRIGSTGPGFPSNGNFVLNELELYYKPDAAAADWQKVPLTGALADYSQQGFDVGEAIDGDSTGNENGWAISPRGRSIHWARFMLQTPIEFTGSGMIRVVLVNRYPNEHQLACFRLSATADDGEIPLGLAEDLAAILRTPAENRNDDLREPLREYFMVEDRMLPDLEGQLAAAQKPLAPHPELVQLRQLLEQARQPLSEPKSLAQLKQDLKYSQAQLENRRLTNAEDLAWALINSPAFLFNR